MEGENDFIQIQQDKTKDKANWGRGDDPRTLEVVKAYVPREQAIRKRFGNSHTNHDRTKL